MSAFAMQIAPIDRANWTSGSRLDDLQHDSQCEFTWSQFGHILHLTRIILTYSLYGYDSQYG